jgi:hypothetical protein
MLAPFVSLRIDLRASRSGCQKNKTLDSQPYLVTLLSRRALFE